jgi:hypothetical protein
MRIILKLAAILTLLSSVEADVAMPTPPKPPDLPTVDGMSSLKQATEPGQLAVAIARLDSIRAAKSDLNRRLKELKADEETTLKELPPASRRKQIYGQGEVDQKATAIRRTLPPMKDRGSIEVSFVVTPDGTTSDIRLVSTPISDTDQITEAVSSWLFIPAIKSDRRVPVRVTTSLRLSDK